MKAAASTAMDCDVLITRTLDAPRALVFKAWTDPEHLLRWYAPNGCTLSIATIDVQPGGAFNTCIHTPDGKDCWCVGTYLELVVPERIVFTLVVADADGNACEPVDVGMDPAWPAETRVTVTFAEDANRMLVTLHQTVAESLAKRTGAHPSWIEMLDRLALDLGRHTGGR